VSKRSTILCIDDKGSNLVIRAKLLEQAGYNVITSANETSALKAVTEQRVDLAVIDYHMLGSANGEEIAKEIRAIHPNLPLVMLTGDPQVPQSARDSVDACLIKGADPVTTLLGTIEKLLLENRGGSCQEWASLTMSAVSSSF
jgi:CheY-like chemotaxis protein